MKQFRETIVTVKSRYKTCLKRTGPAIGFASQITGFIEAVQPDSGQMRVQGWYLGPDLETINNGIITPLERTLPREDVATAHRHRPTANPGFDILMPAEQWLYVRPVGANNHLPRQKISLFRPSEKILAAAVAFAFLPKLVFQHPLTVLKFLLLGDRRAAGILEKKLLPQSFDSMAQSFDMSIFDLNPNQNIPAGQTETAIILPIFNSFELLKECLTRVLTHTDAPYHLILIEDCSSDAAIRPWLRKWAKNCGSLVTLLENSENLGFIGSVNCGLRAAGDRHVVLLNSDAFVPRGWLSRLMQPIFLDQNVASTTPLSNNAEILSLPVLCKENPLGDGAVDRIDAIAQTLNSSQSSIEIPTGIGFCMAMNKRFLQKIPQLDRRFGKGYGEEVDWCQKTRALGGAHLAVTNLFVHHKGGESFGSEKQRRLAKNNAVISRLYPRFDQLVQQFAASDPIKSTRFALAFPSIDIGQPVPIFLTHNKGGGTETYLKNRIRKEHKKAQAVIVIRDQISSKNYGIEIHTEAGVLSSIVTDIAEIKRLLAPIRAREFFYACLVSYREPLKFIDEICDIIDPKHDSFCLQLHDFFPICPSYNLIDVKGGFCNLPSVEICNTCYKNNANAMAASPESIDQWRENWHTILGFATRIEAFSNSSKAIFAKAYPQHTAKIVVIPHDLPIKPQAMHAPKYVKPVIGVLGNIGLNKGAEFIQKAALANKNSGRIIVVGKMNPHFKHPDIAETGPYSVENLAKIAKANGINCWLIPSIWPETFSYTTHEALQTGLPVFAFDLGAQAEAVKKAKNGAIISNRPEALFAQIDTHFEKHHSVKLPENT